MRPPRSILAVLPATVIAAGFANTAAAIDRFVATTGSDANDCLSAATACATIQHAHDTAVADDRINVAAGTYVENVAVTTSVTIAGEAGVLVDGAGAGSVFLLSAPQVTLAALEIANGAAASGGGIHVATGDLTVNDCTVRDNQATGGGGGGIIFFGGALTLNRTTVRDNTASGGGGGVMIFGSATFDRTTVSGNHAEGGSGGGVQVNTGDLTLVNTTLADNTSAVGGGGLFGRNGVLTLRNATIARNRAPDGGGIERGSASITLFNSIVAENVATIDGPDCSGQLNSGGYNLFLDTTGCTITGDVATNLVGMTPLLAELADNGGPTPTMALLAGSRAIDAGNPAGCTNATAGTLTRDQRGRARPFDCGAGRWCDIGAFEFDGCNAVNATPPAAVTGLKAVHDPADAILTWDPVTADAAGQPETVDGYKIYRGQTPDFVPDKASGSNLVGGAGSERFVDPGVVADGQTWYYLVSAVDPSGNEGRTKWPRVATAPMLSGTVAATTIDLTWTDAGPVAEVTGYKVYWGTAPGRYDWSASVGLVNAYALAGLTSNVTYFVAVTAIDSCGNESDFSNELSGALSAQTVSMRILDQGQFCWVGRGPCPPRPGEVQRDAGRELLVPVDFPAGAWGLVELTVTLNSYATASSCVWPDPTGDIFDRLFSVFLVEDETCVDDGSRCWGAGPQLELMHAVTPFGTDTRTGPRVYTIDITPFAPLLSGRKWLGTNINTWDGIGWWADVDLYFSELPAEASPKPPAAGFERVHFSAGSPTTTPVAVTIPSTASDVKMRLWVSGHGGATSPTCPNPADEFCMKNTEILVDGAPVWADVPWRSDCSPAAMPCPGWNACGWTSCTFPRSAWCPGYLTCHNNDPCDQDLDALAWLPPGGTYDVQYQIIDPTPGSWWAFSLVVYWYE